MDNETKQMFELILNRFDKMESRFENLENRFDKMENRFENLENRFDKMENRFENLENRQSEIYQIVKSIEHSNAVHKAEIDNLTYKVAHVEGVINKIGDVIIESRAVK